MTHHTSDSGGAALRRYLGTQWRRAFGLNVSALDGGALFVGGQFRPAQWPLLRAMGVRAVLSLQAEHEDSYAGEPPDRALRLMVPDFHPPTLAQLHEAVAFIGAAHADGLPVLVHCHAGVGRAPLTAASYMVAGGMEPGEALGAIRRARPIIALNDLQLARLSEWHALVARERRG